ncbi:hypothetical protein U9M48_036227 [Paspalum notatum var. saurae]|uniref:Integrase catalytic domain-containing protein n=1 Tax=Paspalum notatum var. saurae TaxID=547442 RepID=A0AAQ3X9U4_PASNO
MTLFGSLLIVLPNPLTSCLSKLITLRPLMLSSTYHGLYPCMEQLQIALGTNLIHSSAYHPQTSGQVERVN